MCWLQTQKITRMKSGLNSTTTSTVDNVTGFPTELVPPDFTHITFVKVIVLSAMFLVSLSANSAVLACVGRRWRRRRLGHQFRTH